MTGPLLEGIQLEKHRRSPVFNNNHLKSLQLARSYKRMESREMWSGRREGGRATSSDSVNLSNVSSSFTWKIQEGLCVHQLLVLKVKKIHCVFLIRVIWGIFELIPSPARGYKQRLPLPPHTSPPTTPPLLSVCSSIPCFSCQAKANSSRAETCAAV